MEGSSLRGAGGGSCVRASRLGGWWDGGLAGRDSEGRDRAVALRDCLVVFCGVWGGDVGGLGDGG